MSNTYTAITKQDGNWWIGWIEELPGVNCQEKSREELLETLKVTLKEALEFNRQEAIRAAVSDYTEEPLTIWSEQSSLNIFEGMTVCSCGKVVAIRGGQTRNRIETHQFQGTAKLEISSLGRSAMIWEYRLWSSIEKQGGYMDTQNQSNKRIERNLVIFNW